MIVLHGALHGAAAVDAHIRILDGAAGDRDGVVRHVAIIVGLAADDKFDRASCERDGVVCHGAILSGIAALGDPDGAAGDRDGVFRHGAIFGMAAADPESRAAGDRDFIARHGAIVGVAAVGIARDLAAGERDGVVRRVAIYGPAAVGKIDIADRHIHPVLFHRAALGPAAINNPIVGRAALDEYMVLREDICPPRISRCNPCHIIPYAGIHRTKKGERVAGGAVRDVVRVGLFFRRTVCETCPVIGFPRRIRHRDRFVLCNRSISRHRRRRRRARQQRREHREHQRPLRPAVRFVNMRCTACRLHNAPLPCTIPASPVGGGFPSSFFHTATIPQNPSQMGECGTKCTFLARNAENKKRRDLPAGSTSFFVVALSLI